MSKPKPVHPKPSVASKVNPGAPFDLARIQRFRVSEREIDERAGALEGLKVPRGKAALAPLLRILGAIDLTTLAGDDGVARVRRLCRTASSPFRPALRKALSAVPGPKEVAAVCVYPVFVPEALDALHGTGIPVATVSAGFPHGLSPLPVRIQEVAAARKAGAHEIDIVIRREWALTGNWKALYEEVKSFRKAAGSRHLKVILATGELEGLNRVGRAALTSLMAGADFVKTSTGKEKVNATLPVGLTMTRAMASYERLTGFTAGIKPAGGIRTAKEAYPWLVMVGEELGEEATGRARFRIGASGLLGDVVGALEKAVVT
jgi:deoxyribose-phosphate aldolase